MSFHKYPLLNKKKEDNLYNNSKYNLRSLDYERNKNDKIYKFIRYNSYSIKNIFNPKKSNDKRISDFPVKVGLNQRRNTTLENQLVIPDNNFQRNNQLERKSSEKSINNENIYKSNSISLEPFSPRRILTIPTQNNHFGYSVDETGSIELLEDPDNIDKFDGTKNNSVGPDRYNIITSPRQKFVIDWSKNFDKKDILNKNLSNDIEKIKLLSKLDEFFLTNVMKKDRRNKNDETKIELSKSNNPRIKDWKKEEEYLKEKFLNYEKEKKEIEACLGPGSYNLTDKFIITPKKEKFQNFGSSKSRNLDSQKKTKTNSMEDNIKYYFLIEKNKENKFENNDKMNIYKNSKFFTYKLKAKLLKEKSIFDKKKIEENLGPGTYETKEIKNKKDNKVGNFGFLEKRNLEYNKDDKYWDGTYLPLEDWTKKFKKNSRYERKKENILNTYEDMNSKEEYNNEENNRQKKEDEAKMNNNYNMYRPGFGSDEPRFYVFKNDINEFNGVGSYNLIPQRKNKVQFAPFIYSSQRHNAVKNDNNPQLGPGTYNKFDTFFQWNKKSYNVKIKNRINEYKLTNN
jgi:hypothetical protein